MAKRQQAVRVRDLVVLLVLGVAAAVTLVLPVPVPPLVVVYKHAYQRSAEKGSGEEKDTNSYRTRHERDTYRRRGGGRRHGRDPRDRGHRPRQTPSQSHRPQPRPADAHA